MTNDEIDWENPPPTTALGIQVGVRGFQNEDAARALGQATYDAIVMLGSYMDLSELEGVTIGIDYDEALASVNLGSEKLSPLDRTNTEDLQGVAKSCRVLRDGIVRSHLVFSAVMILPLILAEEVRSAEDVELAIGLIAHECAHVALSANMEKRVPDARWDAHIPEYRRATLFQIAEICWDEYAVCRLSAPFAPHQNAQHAKTLASALKAPRAEAREAIRAYRLHGDLHRLMAEAGSALCQPMKSAAYLLGGLDAIGADWSDWSKTRDLVEVAGYADLIDRMHAELQRLWSSQKTWAESDDVFEPLRELVAEVFSSGGIHLRAQSDGQCYIDVPFTSDTLPSDNKGDNT